MGAAERHETSAPGETERIAADHAATLRPGDVVLISGDLGAGKTTWVRGALRALGVTQRVTSPTFTIARRYEDGSVPVSHLDLYRLAGSAGEDPAILADEIAPGRITFIEWPEAHAPLLDGVPIAAHVRLEHAGGDSRTISIEPSSATREVASSPGAQPRP